jgi:hypothetical protein
MNFKANFKIVFKTIHYDNSLRTVFHNSQFVFKSIFYGRIFTTRHCIHITNAVKVIAVIM